MQRRDFMLKTATSLMLVGAAATGCTTTVTPTVNTDDKAAANKRRLEITTNADATLSRLYATVHGSRELVAKASGVLTFPSVIAAGFVVGAQYGDGALQVHHATADYYSLTSVSAGLQIGAQSKAIILLFMTQTALDNFRKSEGWVAGVDASVAVLKVGANGAIDVTSATSPVLAFVLTNAGLMANLTLEGTKITRLKL